MECLAMMEPKHLSNLPMNMTVNPLFDHINRPGILVTGMLAPNRKQKSPQVDIMVMQCAGWRYLFQILVIPG